MQLEPLNLRRIRKYRAGGAGPCLECNAVRKRRRQERSKSGCFQKKGNCSGGWLISNVTRNLVRFVVFSTNLFFMPFLNVEVKARCTNPEGVRNYLLNHKADFK